MKKITGVIFAVMMVSALLTGCYSKACGEHPAPVMYKGEG